MKRPLREALLGFIAGSVGYCALETLWRGRTHISMALTGGAVMAAFQLLYLRGKHTALQLCALGCAMITAAEFLCGCIVNLKMKLRVWDYSRRPGNVLGQICPGYSCLWFLLCLPMQKLAGLIHLHATKLRLDRPGTRRI